MNTCPHLAAEPGARDHPPAARIVLPPRPMPGAEPKDDGWDEILAELDIAFQPIVNIHTGACYGYEALLRNYQSSGFDTPQDVFDIAHTLGVLTKVELSVRAKVLEKFARLPNHRQAKVFINIDNRALVPNGGLPQQTRALLDRAGLPESTVVFEISERHPLGQPTDAVAELRKLKQSNFRLAVDDFGTGFSGLQMLYFAEPDFLKIDRFFVSDIASDSRKKLFLSQIVGIAHMLGAVVVAEGVETEREYFVCKEIGCDLVQGWLVQRPTVHLAELKSTYDHIAAMGSRERRSVASDQRLIGAQIARVEPITLDAGMDEVFARFRADKEAIFFPVVDARGEPVGIVRERELKDYVYSRYGQALISNKSLGRRLSDFVVRCPVADINSKAESLLQAYSAVEDGEGIIIVDGLKYAGFLSAHSLLKVINDKNLATARDQNPLTRLPGNNLIHEWVSTALEATESEMALVYFDFDNFKPFNDAYGFRLGDRAILLFAELLTKRLGNGGAFIGHIGGDDFFAGFRGPTLAAYLAKTRLLIDRFAHDVESFYDDETRQQGSMLGHDRAGNAVRFPLLGVSAAVVHLPAGRSVHGIDGVSHLIAALKAEAKHSPDRLCAASLVR